MAQETPYTTANQFYYNSFDNSNLGIFNNYLHSTDKTIVTTSTTTAGFNGTVALKSVPGVALKNNINGSIIPGTSDRNLNNNDFEWTFLYKNNSSVSPVEPYDNGQKPGPVANGEAAWQYWLTASTNDQTSAAITGFYLTHIASKMILRYRASQFDIRSLIDFPITNNDLWTIKIQRLANGHWKIWANIVSAGNYEATTLISTAADNATANTYAYSILATTDLRSPADNFYWDSFKMYTRRMSFNGLNATANGITQPSYYPGQTNVAVFGLQVNLRGTYNFNSINLGYTTSPANINTNGYFTNARIVRSIDDSYNTATDNTTIATFDPNSTPLQSGTISGADSYYTSGNTDGSFTRVSDYFLVMDLLPSLNYGQAPPYANFTFTGPAALTTTDYNNPTFGGYTNNAGTGNNIITFLANPPLAIAYVTPQILTVGTAVALAPATAGNPSSFTLTGTLPAGLTFNASNGVISGTPTTASPAATYTIKAINSSGNASATLTITVIPAAPAVTPIAALCGSGNITLTASGGAPAGGTYNWYNVPTGGTALQSAINSTYTAFVAANTTFYVSYTTADGLTSTRTTATVIVNPKITTPFTGGTFAYPFNNDANDVTDNQNTGVLQNAPVSITDRFGNANSAYLFNGSNQFISTATLYKNPQVFSISLWFNTLTTSGGKLISFSNAQLTAGNQCDRHIYMSNAGKLYFGLYNGTQTTINTPLSYNDGVWHHVVVTVGARNGSKIYVDGALINTGTTGATMTTPQTTNGYWKIGWDNSTGAWADFPTSQFFAGAIDDVAVYNRELSAGEVASANDLNLIGASLPICSGNAITLTAPAVAGATYSWTDGTTTVTGNPAVFPNAATGNYTLTMIAGSCTSTAAITPGAPSYTWTGASSNASALETNWIYTPSNTIQGPAFDGSESLIIPHVSTPPVLGANTAIYSLTIAPGASLFLNNYTLIIGCNLFNNNNTSPGIIGGSTLGMMNGANNITFSGSVSVQNYSGINNAFPVQADHVSVANTNPATGTLVISGGAIDVYNTLSLTSGKLSIQSGTVTLKSTATLTASIPAIISPAAITGKITAERYLSGGIRGYRLVSSPVATGSASGISHYDIKELIKYIYITGTGSYSNPVTLGTTVTSNGFDYSPNGNPSVFAYKESDTDPATTAITTSDFKGFASINEYLPMGNGVMLFYRGDRTLNQAGYALGNAFSPPYPTPNAATLKFVGTPVTGNVVVNTPNFVTGTVRWYNVMASATAIAPANSTLSTSKPFLPALSFTANAGSNKNGFNLVGNPYPSTIDLEKVQFEGAGGWPGSRRSIGIRTLNKNGTYSLYIRNAAAATTGSTDGTTANGGSRYVLSGQGFFVQCLSNTATVTFSEAAKTTYPLAAASGVSAAPAVFSLSKPNPLLRIKLVEDSIYNNETLITFGSEHANMFDIKEDIPYLSGPSQTVFLYSIADKNALIYNQIGSLENVKDPIQLYTEGPNTGIYKLEFSGMETIDPYYRIFLKDAFTKDSLEVSTNPTYTFNLDRRNEATYGASRFTLLVHHSIAGAYELLNFTGYKIDGKAVKLAWDTKNESTVLTFQVQKSTDGGKTFVDLGVVQSSGKGTYSFTDNARAADTENTYRLKQADVNDTISYSALVSIAPDKLAGLTANMVLVYPNPAMERISIDVAQKVTTTIDLQIVNASGTIVRKARFAALQHFEQNISGLLPGNYVVNLVATGTKQKIATTKFIKL